jgi:hypothetical protein
METRQMKDSLRDEIARAVVPLIDQGFSVVEPDAGAELGERIVFLAHDDVRMRILRERGQWFVDVGCVNHAGEWFDIRTVFRALGEATTDVPPEDDAGLAQFIREIAKQSPRWEAGFHKNKYPTLRRQLRALEIASARERFGYP